jgi:protein TonB
MSVAACAADVADDALLARRRDERVLVRAIAASVLLHTVVVVLAPGWRRPAVEPPQPLQVVIVTPPKPEPVRIEPPPRVKPPPPLPVTRAPPVKPQVQPRPAPVPPQSKPVLALPDTTPVAPAFTVPQAQPEAPPAPETKGVVAAPGPAAPVPAAPAPAREAPATPPMFNAAYLGNAPPRYPLIARRNGVEGTVNLRVVVSKEGRPVQVQVDRSSGSSALDNAALEAVKGWKFVPARRGQEAVEQPVVVPIVFRLEGTS